MRTTTLTTAALAALLTACGGGDSAPEPASETDTTALAPAESPPAAIATTYAPELEVDLAAMQETASGLRYAIVSEGSGEVVEPGDTAVVHYTGWLPDGTQFDSSRDRGEPFPFPVGAGQVIAGWDEGVAGMAVGERRKLVIPPDLGYGPMGQGPIPPNATLVFDVELIEVR
ncbi:MAG TPA: FKBP-type peptidyl-prolyl cis-trans isomerase [Actinomycetota bacterium]|nr:FKBP-type peptidyl-prolyl cis-trans isomerase [Actinomycetota bacterium]